VRWRGGRWRGGWIGGITRLRLGEEERGRSRGRVGWNYGLEHDSEQRAVECV